MSKTDRHIVRAAQRVHRSVQCASVSAALLVAVACGGGAGEGDATRTAVITVDGSSTVFPIAEAVAEEFQLVDPAARVTVGVSGTGGGFKKFCAGETDISNGSRPIKAVEIDACAAAGIEFIELPVAHDGISVVVHPDNDWVSTLTPDDLERMWNPAAQGTVVSWSQVRPDWPDSELHLFGPGVDSGTFDYFTQAIVGQEGASRGDFTSSEDDNVLVQGVATDPLALGFFGYAYYEANRDRLKLLSVDDGDETNGAGAVAPSPESVRDGTYQPLSRPIFIYVNPDALERSEVSGFVNFFLSDGASLVREVGYVPLSDAEYALVQRRVDDRVIGTMFGSGVKTASLTVLLEGGR
jgi:phosphate transport system substrate-binding protein